MLGNFTYSNPTKLYFGKDSLQKLHKELPNYGETVLLVYGGGSIKASGLYDEIVEILRSHSKTIIEDPGVMPNPTVDKLRAGSALARTHDVDLILAVGGGSVCDYAKAVSVSAWCGEDPWEKYYQRMEDVDNRIIPVGCILTMVGTGSEMNGGSVIYDPATHQKIGHVFRENVFPKFSILNPALTFTIPRRQMVSGFFDIMSHILEQYFSGEDDNTSDYLMEGLLRSLIHSSRIALADPTDYEARSNIMWTATWALNTLIAKGKTTDWMLHMIGHAIGAHTDATHGMTLSAIAMPYYQHILPHGLPKFRRYAVNVWAVDPAGRSDEAVAREGLERMAAYMEELGVVMDLRELGVTEAMLKPIADGAFILDGGYKKLSREDILAILKQSMGPEQSSAYRE